MTKVALVLGATGLVGSALVEQLASCSEFGQVLAFSRRVVNYESTKVRSCVLDFEQLQDSADEFQGDVLFLCLGTTKKQAGSISAQRLVDFDYQLQVASFAAANGVKHCVLVSSSGADRRSLSAYLAIKGDLEQQIKQLGFKRLSIVQPSMLTGMRKQRRLGEVVGAKLLSGLSFIPGIRRYRPIAATEVAARLLALSQQELEGLEYIRLEQVFTKLAS